MVDFFFFTLRSANFVVFSFSLSKLKVDPAVVYHCQFQSYFDLVMIVFVPFLWSGQLKKYFYNLYVNHVFGTWELWSKPKTVLDTKQHVFCTVNQHELCPLGNIQLTDINLTSSPPALKHCFTDINDMLLLFGNVCLIRNMVQLCNYHVATYTSTCCTSSVSHAANLLCNVTLFLFSLSPLFWTLWES